MRCGALLPAACALGLLCLLPVAAADNCSTPDDCEQTANYNTTIAVGGGVIAAVTGAVVSTIPGTPKPPRPGMPLTDPYTGQPLTIQDGTRGGGGQPGDVWWPWGGGRWVHPDEVQTLIQQGQDETTRDAVNRDARWKVMQAEDDADWHRQVERERQQAADEVENIRRSQEADRREAARQARRGELRDEMEVDRRQLADANSWAGWGRNVNDEFWDRTLKDVDSLPGELQSAGRSLVNLTTQAVKDAMDPETWRIAADTAGHTLLDVGGLLIGDPGTYDKHLPTYDHLTDLAGKALRKAAADPIGFVKDLTPIRQWQDAMDPDVPLGSRIWKTWMATVDTVLLVDGVRHVATGVLETMESEADAVAKALRQQALPPKLTPAQLKAANEAWEEQRAASKATVDAYEQAVKDAERAKRAKDAAALEAALGKQREAALQLQADKVALQDINRRVPGTIQSFNKDMRAVYDRTDKGMLDWAAKEHRLKDLEKVHDEGGLRIFRDADGNEVHILEPTNPTTRVKAPSDRDYTMRLKRAGADDAVDIPHAKVQKAYDKAFYDAAGGDEAARRLGLPQDPGAFTHHMDQVCTDRLHAEAYGRSAADLDTALKHPDRAFSDPEQIGKVVAHKANEWYTKGNPFEATRQTLKQYDNQAIPRFTAAANRIDAAQQQGLVAKGLMVRPPDPQLNQAMEIFRKVHGPQRMSPAQAEEELRRIGTTMQDASRRVGDYIAGLDRARPRILGVGG